MPHLYTGADKFRVSVENYTILEPEIIEICQHFVHNDNECGEYVQVGNPSKSYF